MIIWGRGDSGLNEALANFVAHVTDLPRGFGECKAMGVVDAKGGLIAGVVFHNWNPEAGTIEVSAGAVSKRWITREVVRAISQYAFIEAGCQMLVARFSENNKALRRMFEVAGGTVFVIPRMRGRHEAECLMTLTDDAWVSSKIGRI